MISKADVEVLAQRKAAPDSPVLSVYHDNDQSQAANLNRRFAASLNCFIATTPSGSAPAPIECRRDSSLRGRGSS